MNLEKLWYVYVVASFAVRPYRFLEELSGTTENFVARPSV